MRITTEIVVLIETNEIVSQKHFDYQGPVSLAISAGGQGSKQKSQQQSQQSSTSGVAYNEPFLNLMFGQGGQFYGTKDGQEKYTPGVFGYEPDKEAAFVRPGYTGAGYEGGAYTPGKYTPGQFTAVAPEGFKRLEDVAYGSQAARIGEAYNQNVNRLREELSQSGQLNSPAQYLEGGARSSMDRSYLDSLQQAARDAFGQRLGLEEREAGRRTGYDVGEAGARTAFDVGQGAARTAYDVGQGAARTAFGETEAARRTGYDVAEAGRETTYNQKAVDDLWQRFMAKLAYALEASKFGTSAGWSSGESSGFSMGLKGSYGKVSGD